jgi:hypothetical protein
MDAKRMMREAQEMRARRGRQIGIMEESVDSYQAVSGSVPGGHLDNARVIDISLQTITGLWPFGGTMDLMLT